MRLEFFDAGDGDCFLLTSSWFRRGKHMLVDGGRSTEFRDNCLPRLRELRAAGETLDVVCVSHIDADHITGIIALFDEMLDWRVFDFQRATGNATFPPPHAQRLPDVGKLWHNGFESQVGAGAGPGTGTSVLTAMASILAASDAGVLRGQAEMPAELASSIEQGVVLSRQIGTSGLNIPLNPEFAGIGSGLMRRTDQGVELPKIGKARPTLLGPSQKQLDDLASCWAQWVADNQAKIATIDADAARQAERMGLATDELLRLRGLRATEFADAGKVTVPNLASIMLLVEEGRKSALLTGDGFGEDVVAGLDAAGKLFQSGGYHAELLKVPHHGSEFNSDREFYGRITADHYVISANGAHHNPDLRVVDDILRSRMGPRSDDTLTRQRGNPFTIWVTNSPDDPSLSSTRRAHLREVRDEATGFINGRDQATVVFVEGPGVVVDLGED